MTRPLLDTAFATGLEGWVMLLRWMRSDVQEGMLIEMKRWFQWGYAFKNGEKEPHGWYIFLRLPSYVMQQAWHRWDGAPTWHQRVLFFKQILPSGPGGWEVVAWECRDQERS